MNTIEVLLTRLTGIPPRQPLTRLVTIWDSAAARWRRALLGHAPLAPPRLLVDLLQIGTGDFGEIGRQCAEHLVQLCGLRPDSAVLDVGCGIGRVAIPLTEYLNADGTYCGFDVSAEAVKWCTQRITSRCPNFTFTVANVYNKQYNPRGKHAAPQFAFPYDDDRFDCVFATSVFTHMLPDGVEQYLHEIQRVLRSDGSCLLTFFLLNDEARTLITAGRSLFSFPHQRPGCWISNEEVPESAVAYEEAAVGGMLGKAGLMVSRPVQYGAWCGREHHASGQDLVVAAHRTGKVDRGEV